MREMLTALLFVGVVTLIALSVIKIADITVPEIHTDPVKIKEINDKWRQDYTKRCNDLGGRPVFDRHMNPQECR